MHSVTDTQPKQSDQGDSMRGAPLPKKVCISFRQAKIRKRRRLKGMNEVRKYYIIFCREGGVNVYISISCR